jgi:hypothetical protein
VAAGWRYGIDLAAALIINLWKFPVPSGDISTEHRNRFQIGSGSRSRMSPAFWEAAIHLGYGLKLYCK